MSNMKKAEDGSKLLTGQAGKTAKLIKKRKRNKQLQDVMQGLRYSRKRK